MKTLCVFTDPEDARFEWLLKPGFRHVFACLCVGDYWMMFDPRDGRPDMGAIADADFDLQAFYEAEGYTVVEIEQGPPLRTPIIVANCVGLTKAVLCIRAPLAFTPYQLYQHLLRSSP